MRQNFLRAYSRKESAPLSLEVASRDRASVDNLR